MLKVKNLRYRAVKSIKSKAVLHRPL